VAMVSHELRTPLNAILGWTQLMLQSTADQDMIARGLDVISRNTRVQAQLVSDLLDVSRITSGKLRLNIEQVDLVSLVRNVVETVQHAGDSKQLTVRQEFESDAIPIAGDPARLQQIVWNLLWNAIKFTPEGGSVAARVRHREDGAEITVSDTGVGIRPEVLPHIFERFNQASPLRAHGISGLGLGLSIVKHLVELHGGSIRADSAGEGKGATFTVVLPSGVSPEAADATVAGQEGHPNAHDLLQGLRILVVEDEADTLEFLGRFLAAQGAQVTTTTTAQEALAQLTRADADLLISDIGLPEIDGYELLERIRQAESGAGGGMPAIALTAYVRPEDRARAFRAGYQEHLGKPIEPAELVAAIARILQLNGKSR
jgi:CheY-like chemotaxis protein/two-component sensor histidine kinase